MSLHKPLHVSYSQPCSDHRDVVRAYDLGHIEEHSPGLIHWHPAGRKVMRLMQEDVLDLHEEFGYSEVQSPAILHRSLWEKSGHWDKYQAHMYVAHGGAQDEEQDMYALKPMSCPGHIAIFAHRRRSYRELPVKLFEFGHVHRREPAGSLSGWMRLRGFVQDDSHVFCAIEQIGMVVAQWGQMVERVYRAFGFSHWAWRLSLRPDERAGDDSVWDQAEQALRQACLDMGVDAQEQPGGGAFYGPKLEAVLVDRLGREWQCGVAQVDFVLPERFGLSYQNAQGQSAVPVMVHHAVMGSLERWLAIVLEHHGALPDAYAPELVMVSAVGGGQSQDADALVERLQQSGVRAVRGPEGPLAGQMRWADERRIPHRWVLGAREVAAGAVSQRVWHDASLVEGVEVAIGRLVGLSQRRD